VLLPCSSAAVAAAVGASVAEVAQGLLERLATCEVRLRAHPDALEFERRVPIIATLAESLRQSGCKAAEFTSSPLGAFVVSVCREGGDVRGAAQDSIRRVDSGADRLVFARRAFLFVFLTRMNGQVAGGWEAAFQPSALASFFGLDLQGCEEPSVWLPRRLPACFFSLALGPEGRRVACAGPFHVMSLEGDVGPVREATPAWPNLVLDVGDRATELRVVLPDEANVALPAIHVDGHGKSNVGFRRRGALPALSLDRYLRAVDVFLAGIYVP
jgi:hypothetical protein